MVKEVDSNGFWRIKNNPLSKEGVFPYLGRQIDKSLEPNKIYWVYRPMSEISNPETVESFNAAPLIDEHEMIGEGWTKYDDRPAGGVVYNTRAEDGKLYGDIRIYSEKLKDEIESGKKELSMGYECNYEAEHGVFDGKAYDFVQRNLRGNHIALVNRGRMGSDVRVYDHFTFDTLEGLGEFEQEAQDKQEEVKITVDEKEVSEVKEDSLTVDEEIPSQDGNPKESGVGCSLSQQGTDSMEKVDKRKGISEVEAMLYEAKKDPAKLTDELIKTILQKMEDNSYEASEKTKADDEAPEKDSEDEDKACEDSCGAKDECGKKEDDAKDESEVAKEENKEEAPTEEKEDEGKKEDKKAEDAAIAVMDALPEILKRLENIEASLVKGHEDSKPEVMYGLDEAPVKSNKMDLGLKLYLGE